MSLKANFNKEKSTLMQNKKPYETAAFIIFAVCFLQQVAVLLYRIIDFFVDIAKFGAGSAFFSTTGLTTPAFFARIVAFDTSKVIFLIIAILALVLWYYLIYVFVFRYSSRHGYAKWTWTALVVFGPTLFLIPPYIIYAAYVFRPYLFRFIKRAVQEYKEFDKDKPMPEEQEEVKS